jgi:hypothetical protein
MRLSSQFIFSGGRVAKDGDFTFVKIAVPAIDAHRFTFPATTIGQKLHQISAPFRPATVTVSDGNHQFDKMFLARSCKSFCRPFFRFM